MDEVAEAVRRAARGEATLDPSIATRVVQEFQGTQRTFSAANPYAELTERELEVLKLIAQGLSNQEITTQLVISEHTVKGHVSNILSKLHLADRTQAAIFAWREGVVRRS
jgi:NarL family two-component system response regulator LiaR